MFSSSLLRSFPSLLRSLPLSSSLFLTFLSPFFSPSVSAAMSDSQSPPDVAGHPPTPLYLIELPRELLQIALSFCPAVTLAQVARLSRLFKRLVEDACRLYRLRIFPDARATTTEMVRLLELSALPPVFAANAYVVLLAGDKCLFQWHVDTAHVASTDAEELVSSEQGLFVHNPRMGRIKMPVQNVAAGSSHCALVTTDGRLFTWGSNDYGELGLGHSEQQNQPALVTLPGELLAAKVACGCSFTLALARSGDVCSFGVATHGRLGRGGWSRQPHPSRIAGLSRIIDVSAGDGHSLAVNAEGELFSWGAGYAGCALCRPERVVAPCLGALHASELCCVRVDRQLGLGKRGNAFEPTKVKLGSEKAAQASAGGSHSICLCVSGKVYAFGENDDGCLGSDVDSALSPMLVGDIPCDPLNVKRVLALDRRSLVFTDAGRLYLLERVFAHKLLPVAQVTGAGEVDESLAALQKNGEVVVLNERTRPCDKLRVFNANDAPATGEAGAP